MYSYDFLALLNEAQFANETLASGATQIRKAAFYSKGLYFLAFTSLSVCLERIGKLCLILDYAISNSGEYPSVQFIRNQIGHNLVSLYEHSQLIKQQRNFQFTFAQALDNELHQEALLILSDFARGERYSNIDLILTGKASSPVARWFDKIDKKLFALKVSEKKKRKIAYEAAEMHELTKDIAYFDHILEDGTRITKPGDYYFGVSFAQAIFPYRQLLVLQIIRYWVELTMELGRAAMASDIEVPFFSEIFAQYFNPDSYLRTRKTW